MPRSRVDMRKVRRDVEDFRFFFVPIFRTPAIALVRACLVSSARAVEVSFSNQIAAFELRNTRRVL